LEERGIEGLISTEVKIDVQKYCPLIKDYCKGQEYIMCIGEYCLVLIYLKSWSILNISELMSIEEETEEEVEEKKEILQELNSKSIEELAEDIFSYIIENSVINPDLALSHDLTYEIGYRKKVEEFLAHKGISIYEVPKELRNKIERAKTIVLEKNF